MESDASDWLRKVLCVEGWDSGTKAANCFKVSVLRVPARLGTRPGRAWDASGHAGQWDTWDSSRFGGTTRHLVSLPDTKLNEV